MSKPIFLLVHDDATMRLMLRRAITAIYTQARVFSVGTVADVARVLVTRPPTVII